jgi:hypothetical protein
MPQEQLFEDTAAVPGHVASTDQFGGTGTEAMQRGADISPCGLYRYALWCAWGPGAWVNWCCLNPSKADAKVNDPSFVRMMNFARTWGFDGLIVTNLFAFRATDPRDMKAAADPVGPLNDRALLGAHLTAKRTVAAWGAHGTYRGRDAQVRAMLPGLHYLRLTKGGHPGHPLYLPASLRPVEWVTPNKG